MNSKNSKSNTVSRPPVVAIMGHIDHGKSTLLDYIRKTNIVECEAGGITQCISAYEVVHEDENGQKKKITFLDTPGHEAFSKMRERGAAVADIAILIVSAEDGVKPQTLEAWQTILASQTPCIVAINKIDKPNANIEKTKTELAENEIYLENYGGSTPFAEISAKTGDGVDNLLSLILILSELEGFTGNPEENASGYVIEVNLDQKRGILATLVIKNGSLQKGMTVAVEDCVCSTRIIENFKGEMIDGASFSAPVRIMGFDKMPKVGAPFESFTKKSEAEKYAKEWRNQNALDKNTTANTGDEEEKKTIPIIIKADVAGSIEAIEKEIEKIKDEHTEFRVIAKGVGPVSESDIKGIATGKNVLIIDFNVGKDRSAIEMAEQRGIAIASFDIIYKVAEWLGEQMEERRVRVETQEITGRTKVLRVFTKTKERQILGGKVQEGQINLSDTVKVLRRDFEIGKGRIVNLEKNKVKASSVEEGSEFGMMLETKIEIAPGDILESFKVVKK